MTQKIPDELLAQIVDLLKAQTGLFFPHKRWPDLSRGLAAAARDLGCTSAAECARLLLAAPLTREQIEILASHLTVGETYFFREKPSLAILENRILPELIRDRRNQGRRLRIWSAGCSSGEEAYTIAILLQRLIADLDNWQIHLLATDIDAQALKKAVQGLYGKWSFRDMPPEILERYFIKRERQWEIQPRLRSLVKFEYLNLAQDPYPSLVTQTNAMDLILCRNVLMYFSPKQARQVLENFGRALVEGGWLITGLTETSALRFSPLAIVNFPGATVYRKDAEISRKVKAGAACPTLPPALHPAGGNAARPGFPAQQPWPLPSPSWTPPAAAAAPTPAPEAAAAATPVQPAAPVEEMIRSARHCADQGDLAAALSWCDQAVAADRLNPAWHYLRAAILQEQEAVAEAILSLRKALYLDQDFVMGHFALGNLALRQADNRAARKHFHNVLALLEGYPPEEPLPAAEGITAGRLKEIVHSTMTMRKLSERHAAAR
ncbi:MAG: CheR family methyltransferase [Desulfobaccales bacterium]